MSSTFQARLAIVLVSIALAGLPQGPGPAASSSSSHPPSRHTEARAALPASRAPIVGTADETRRRFARDLHYGAQRRFVNVDLVLHLAQAAVPTDLPDLAADLDVAAVALNRAIDSRSRLRVRGSPLEPDQGRTSPGAARAGQPVRRAGRSGHADGWPPVRPIEVAAYYVVSEALTNAAKHGHAWSVTVRVEAAGDRLRLGIRDDGVGGADFGRGSGLVGLKDRVEAFGGWITLQSEPDAGTSLEFGLPLTASVGASERWS